MYLATPLIHFYPISEKSNGSNKMASGQHSVQGGGPVARERMGRGQWNRRVGKREMCYLQKVDDDEVLLV